MDGGEVTDVVNEKYDVGQLDHYYPFRAARF